MKYNLDPEFEKLTAALAATDEKFWQRVGRHVDPHAVVDEASATIYKICREVAQEGCPSAEVVRQRATYLLDDGKLTSESLEEIRTILELSKQSWDAEALANELVVPVRQARFREIAKRLTVVGVSAQDPRFDSYIEEMMACDAIGLSKADQDTPASEFGLDTEELLADAPLQIQMPTGIGELDVLLRGGPALGSLVTMLMDSKAGKSMWLNHVAAVAALHGEHVGYLSLELEESDVHRRLMAAVAGVAINDLLDRELRKDAAKIVKKLYAENRLGKIFVGAFPPKSLNERDIAAWFDKQEKDKGVRIRFRVVDYGDVVVSSKREDRESEYRTGFTVWSALKAMASGNGDPNWVFTAAQAKRPEWKPGQPIPILGRASTGDSRHKYQLSDLFLTGTPQPDIAARNGYVWFVDADRHFGATGEATQVVPHFRHMGRMADISFLGL